MNLTPKQIQALRIAVAEAAGWTSIMHAEDWRGRPMEPKLMWLYPGGATPHEEWQLPNYPESLDAVHEVVSGLPDQSRHAYAVTLSGELWKPARTRGWQDYRDTLAVSEATALHRCIAILMTLNPEKWLEIQNLKD